MSDKVYEIITEQMIKALESGQAPWQQPWSVSANGPRNIDGRPYHGMNTFLLLAMGHESPYWLTRRQIDERGGKTRTGERYTPVIFWKIAVSKTRLDDKGNPTAFPLLRFYQVWNLEQIDGINPPVSKQPTPEFTPVEAAEKIVANYPDSPPIKYGYDGAVYYPTLDEIRMPARESFDSVDRYYSTLFHEMTHSTGHENRLDRPNKNVFGTHTYGREELVAEMGAAFLCGETGILQNTITHSAAYLKSWIKLFRDDPKMVVWAAGKAQKAANHILGRIQSDSRDEESVS